jgi:four helix bundle protein
LHASFIYRDGQEESSAISILKIDPFCMATVKTFEDLKMWQAARTFSRTVYELTNKGSFAQDWALRNQINESTGSIMDNIAEGFERGGNKEFLSFLSYAKGSAGESRSQLYRAFDRRHITEMELGELKSNATHISSMISRFMQHLQNTTMKGFKFHEPEELYDSGPTKVESQSMSRSNPTSRRKAMRKKH